MNVFLTSTIFLDYHLLRSDFRFNPTDNKETT